MEYLSPAAWIPGLISKAGAVQKNCNDHIKVALVRPMMPRGALNNKGQDVVKLQEMGSFLFGEQGAIASAPLSKPLP